MPEKPEDYGEAVIYAIAGLLWLGQGGREGITLARITKEFGDVNVRDVLADLWRQEDIEIHGETVRLTPTCNFTLQLVFHSRMNQLTDVDRAVMDALGLYWREIIALSGHRPDGMDMKLLQARVDSSVLPSSEAERRRAIDESIDRLCRFNFVARKNDGDVQITWEGLAAHFVA